MNYATHKTVLAVPNAGKEVDQNHMKIDSSEVKTKLYLKIFCIWHKREEETCLRYKNNRLVFWLVDETFR